MFTFAPNFEPNLLFDVLNFKSNSVELCVLREILFCSQRTQRNTELNFKSNSVKLRVLREQNNISQSNTELNFKSNSVKLRVLCEQYLERKFFI